MRLKDYVAVFVPLVLFFMVQTGLAITTIQDLKNRDTFLLDEIEEVRTTKASFTTEQRAENQRVWLRINKMEEQLVRALANEQAIAAVVTAIKEDVTLLRLDIRANNKLLREVLGRSAR